jgi:hypothetical protein
MKALVRDLQATSASMVAQAETLLGESRHVLDQDPQLVTACHQTGRARLQAEHEERAKQSLARMAAQLAGRFPDERVRVELAGYVAFDDHVWRYPDFLQRADRAFAELAP